MAEGDCLIYTSHSYGSHHLQKVGLWQVGTEAGKPPGDRWVVYIHGGAWRDPKILHKTFTPTINQMMKSDDLAGASIAAFASIDYRLSPHPDHPQDPKDVPSADLRNACHPDHVNDVHEALRYLKTNCGMPDNYLLVGHSAGATLAFQLLMEPAIPSPPSGSNTTPLPVAILGVSGIYDLVGLDERHEGYSGFISSAFGNDKKEWAQASPAHFTHGFKKHWPKGKTTVLAWSTEDSLIDEAEIDTMVSVLKAEDMNVSSVKDLTGEHDFIWEDGSQLARLIFMTLSKLRESG